MGQYYRFIFLSESGEIIHWIDSYDFHSSKMMDFAWLDLDGKHDSLVEAAEQIITGYDWRGILPRYRVVCAGDYGAPEPKSAGSIWTEKKEDLETLLAAVNAAARYSLADINHEEVTAFLKKSPLDYDETDRTFARRCLSAWYDRNMNKNLYHMCNDLPDRKIKPMPARSLWFPYIVNHSKKEFVDKRKNTAYTAADSSSSRMREHPLPLLVCETAGGGGGDYSGTCESDVGCWARDIITAESVHPGDDYKEFIVGFKDEN